MNPADSSKNPVISGYSLRKRPHPTGGEPSPAAKKKKTIQPAEGQVYIRQSRIKANDGAGLGLFTKAKTEQTIAFVKGEEIMTVQGCLALRISTEDGRDIEWLYDSGRIHGLSESAHVIWSNSYLNTPKGLREVEPGIQSDDLSYYANDSIRYRSANCKMKVTVNCYQGKEGLFLKPEKESSVKVKLIAQRNIMDNEELTWCYAPNRAQESSYTNPAAEAFNPERDLELIKTHTKAALPDSEAEGELVLVEDPASLHLLRWQSASKIQPLNFQFTQEEKPYQDLMNTEKSAGIHKVLKKAHATPGDPTPLLAYFKFKLNNASDIIGVLKKLQISLRSFRQFYQKGTEESEKSVSISAIYDYCVVNKLIDPAASAAAIPLAWLAEKIKEKKDDLELQHLLMLRLQSMLIKPVSNPLQNVDIIDSTSPEPDRSTQEPGLTENKHPFINLCPPNRIAAELNSAGVPNPLGGDKWKPLDILTVSRHPAAHIKNPTVIQNILDTYTKAKRKQGLSSLVFALALFGHVNAIKAIVERRIHRKHRVCISELSRNFIDCGITIPLKGLGMVESTSENLSLFIQERCDPELTKTAQPSFMLTQVEFSERMAGSKSDRISCGKVAKKLVQICDSEEGQLQTLSEVFRSYVEDAAPETIKGNLLRKARTYFPELKGSELVAKLQALPENSWFYTVFPLKTLSDEALFRQVEGIDTRSHSEISVNSELLERIKGDQQRIKLYILAIRIRRANHKAHEDFRNLSNQLNTHNCLPNKKNWTLGKVKDLYLAGLKSQAQTLTAEEMTYWLQTPASNTHILNEKLCAVKDTMHQIPADKQPKVMRIYIQNLVKLQKIETGAELLHHAQGVSNIPCLKAPPGGLTTHHIAALFKGEPDTDWLKPILSTELSSDEEIVQYLASRSGGSRKENENALLKMTSEALFRGIDDHAFRLRILPHLRNGSAEPETSFIKRIAGLFSAFRYKTKEGKPVSEPYVRQLLTEGGNQNPDI